MYLPAVFAAYTGQSLDEKTPLHRAVQSLSKQGVRLLGHLGLKTTGLVNHSACCRSSAHPLSRLSRDPAGGAFLQSAWSRNSSSFPARPI